MIGKLTGTTPPDASPVTTRIQETVTDTARENPWGLFGGGAAGLAGLFFGLRKYARHRKRRCPTCGRPMVRLDERADNAFLDEGQQQEEALNSIDYDVWHCQACNAATLIPYKAWFSSYSQCPKCGYRTMHVSRYTVVEPTYSSTGQGTETRDCRHCSYHTESTYTIAQRVESSSSDDSSSCSSSSGSDSFGGGSSSGGGASGSW